MTTRRLLVRIDRTKCVGSRMCIQVAPETFTLDASRLPQVADPPRSDVADLVDAVNQCPMAAISIVDAATGRAVNPDDLT